MKNIKNAFFALSALALLSSCGGVSASKSTPSAFVPEIPTLPERVDTDSNSLLLSFGDVVRSESVPFSERLPGLDDASLYAVTNRFGKSTIPMSALPFKSAVAESATKPWSSWWYPKIEDALFRDKDSKNLSPLSKYDLYRGTQPSTPGSAAQFEAQRYNSNSLRWEGLCDGWSFASILSPEPKAPLTISAGDWTRRQYTFSVSDQKALLLMTYDDIGQNGLSYFGQKFTGDQDGWIHPDVFPDQFHRFVEVQLFDQKEAFIMDHDAGIEVWNVPVFKANYSVEAVPGNPNAVFVRTWLVSAESSATQDREFVGTKTMLREYDYVLYGKPDANGNLVVDSGVWVKGPNGVDSRRDHPDYFIRIEDRSRITRKSHNSAIDPAVVDRILRSSP